MSQTNFSQRVNELFFGVDVSNKSASLLDSFHLVPQLNHRDNGVRQRNLKVAMEMKSDKARYSRQEFVFIESPLRDLKIENGAIEVTISETDSTKKLLGLIWRLQFSDKAAATKYFDKLKQLFGDVATKKKVEHKKGVGDFAKFSSSNQVDTGVRNITLFFHKSSISKKYRIILVLGSGFMNE